MIATEGATSADVLAHAEVVPGLPAGISAWTTTKMMGSFGLGSEESVGEVMARWDRLQTALGERGVQRLASAHQIHGADVVIHRDGWRGWLRERGIDGHVSAVAGTALAITVADCTPVFIAHPAGVIAALHAGWRGTAAGILSVGFDALAALGCPPDECVVHLGPSICANCYEVGPEVLEAVTGRPATGKGCLDVRAALAEQAQRYGVGQLTTSNSCTRCDNDRFFSHRGGDLGRQLGVIALRA
ncbi:MAG: polyphenol oxidase family protein [Gemmatimonadaceae bacterium]|nr:polyphenol oxidase family protein [Gemmatimonadaceae bacterium]